MRNLLLGAAIAAALITAILAAHAQPKSNVVVLRAGESVVRAQDRAMAAALMVQRSGRYVIRNDQPMFPIAAITATVVVTPAEPQR